VKPCPRYRLAAGSVSKTSSNHTVDNREDVAILAATKTVSNKTTIVISDLNNLITLNSLCAEFEGKCEKDSWGMIKKNMKTYKATQISEKVQPPNSTISTIQNLYLLSKVVFLPS
jgi:hypothetical protein